MVYDGSDEDEIYWHTVQGKSFCRFLKCFLFESCRGSMCGSERYYECKRSAVSGGSEQLVLLVEQREEEKRRGRRY